MNGKTLMWGRLFLLPLVGIAGGLAANVLLASTQQYDVLINVDNNSVSGCSVVTAKGTGDGIEKIVRATVDTTPATASVTALQLLTCIGGSNFSAPVSLGDTPYTLALNNGSDGTSAVELTLPLAALDLDPDLTQDAIIRLAASSLAADGSADALLPLTSFKIRTGVPDVSVPPGMPVPTMGLEALLGLAICLAGIGGLMIRRFSKKGLNGSVHTFLLLGIGVVLFGLGGAIAYAITKDGLTTDWTGSNALITGNRGDAVGTATGNADLVGLFVQLEDAQIALRIDADIRLEPTNAAPTVSAGDPQTITLSGPTGSASANLNGTASDDGLPGPPNVLTLTWSKVSGPGPVDFADASLAATTATFNQAGSYLLRLTGSDSLLETSSDVTITVNPPENQAPEISDLPPAFALDLPGNSLSFSPTVTDDGLPANGLLTYRWTQIEGSRPVFFGIDPDSPPSLLTTELANAAREINTRAATAFFDFDVADTYVLRFVASDGALSSSRDITIVVSAAASAAPVIGPFADQTVPLGSTLTLPLAANDSNPRDSLTYSLVAAPTGAELTPADSSRFAFTPTDAQIGTHNVTVRVSDSTNQSAQTSFSITVANTNRPPRFTEPNKADAATAAGGTFTRQLSAMDPDNDDTLTYALVDGPSGMTVANDGALSWQPLVTQFGEHYVKVRVVDNAGGMDAALFHLLVRPNNPPDARDDSYSVNLGETLTINPADGVLQNDTDADGDPLTAIKLSDPDKGTLDAFNADGSFNYTAPDNLPPPPGLNPVVSWRVGLVDNTRFALAADFDHDSVVDYVSSTNGDFRAWRGSDGAQLWQFDKSITTHADISGCATYINSGQFALGDVTSSGDIYLFASVNCDTLGTAGQEDRYFAANASQILPGGKIATQWVSPRLSQPHPGAYATNTSPTLPDPPVTPTFAASAWRTVPTLAKLTEDGPTKLLTRFLASSTYGYYYDTPNSGHLAYAACRTITGLPADEGRACKATFVIDAATGAIDEVLTSPNPADEYVTPRNSPTEQNIPIVADLDGDGQVEIISGGDIWKLVDGVWTLAWQAEFDANTGPKKSFEPSSVAVADLDGDGKTEVVFHLLANYFQAGGVYIFDHAGTLLRKIPISTNVSGLLSVADVDADGAPEILVVGDSFLYVYRPGGALLWAKRLPDILTDPPIAPGSGGEPMTSESQLYVYDLDLDGVPEVIVQGTRRLFILNGRTGTELWSIDTESDGFFRPGNPLLVDADNDGHVDIIVHLSERWNCSYGGGPVDCLGNAMRISGGDNNWAPGPKVQNQLNFRPGATDDDAKILYDASVRRDFRQQTQQGTVIDPRIAQSTSFTYKANDGAADSAPATVWIGINPQNRPPVITSTPPSGLLSVTPYTRRVYTITATDPDLGDTVHYEFVSSNFDTTYFPAPTVDPVTGGVDIYSGPCGSYGGACDFGRVLVIVAAVDSQGARTEQSFFVDITYSAVGVPDVIGQLLPTARTAIEAASLTPLVVTELFGLQPAGTVIAQDPLAGTASVPRSATVKLTISKGLEPVLVPGVTGLPFTLAQSRFSNAGFSVTEVRQFDSAPTGTVIAQSPAAGLSLPPGNATLTVSAGNGLALTLSSAVITADQTITLQPLAFDVNGNATALPELTYSISPARTPFLGTLPVVSGTTITPALETLGAFSVTATDSGNARSASAIFTVMLPQLPEKSTNGAQFAALMATLQAFDGYGPALRAARAANDEEQMRTILGQMVNTWRALDIAALRLATPIVLPQGFAPTLEHLQSVSPGLQPTADDLMAQVVLRDSIDDLQAITAAFRAPGGGMLLLNSLMDQFLDRIRRIDALTMSEYGLVMNAPEMIVLTSRVIPDFYTALTDEMAVVANLPLVNKNASLANVHRLTKLPRMKTQSTLAEVTTTMAVDFIVDKIIEEAEKTYKNSKKYAGDLLAQTGWAAAMSVARATALPYLQGMEIPGVVSGASLSFHSFSSPYAFIEVPMRISHPLLANITILGPDLVTGSAGLLNDIWDSLKKGLSYGKDALTNPDKFKNADDLFAFKKKLESGVKKIVTLHGEYKVIVDSMYQTPTGVDFGSCIFVADPVCTELLFEDGIGSVYTYAPPDGFDSLTGIPLPILMIVEDKRTGTMFFGTPIFMPQKP